MMYYDSLAEDEIYSQQCSLTKSITYDHRISQPFQIENHISVALPSSPAVHDEEEEAYIENNNGLFQHCGHYNSSEYPHEMKAINPESTRYKTFFNSKDAD